MLVLSAMFVHINVPNLHSFYVPKRYISFWFFGTFRFGISQHLDLRIIRSHHKKNAPV